MRVQELEMLRQIEEQLLSGEGIHYRSLGEELGVSDRTVRRYLDVLREIGGPTHYDDRTLRHTPKLGYRPLFRHE